MWEGRQRLQGRVDKSHHQPQEPIWRCPGWRIQGCFRCSESSQLMFEQSIWMWYYTAKNRHLKKVALVKIVARLKDDGGKKDKEEHCWRKGLNLDGLFRIEGSEAVCYCWLIEAYPFSLSFWQSGHKQAKDGAEKNNGEAFGQVVELDLKQKRQWNVCTRNDKSIRPLRRTRWQLKRENVKPEA